MPGTPGLTLELDGGPGSVRLARRATAAFLDDQVTPGTAEDTSLVVSELVSNACRHAPGRCALSVAVAGGGVQVAVEDSRPPPLLPAGAPGPAGWGLRLVASLTRGIHVVPVARGKLVSATVRPRPGG